MKEPCNRGSSSQLPNSSLAFIISNSNERAENSIHFEALVVELTAYMWERAEARPRDGSTWGIAGLLVNRHQSLVESS